MSFPVINDSCGGDFSRPWNGTWRLPTVGALGEVALTKASTKTGEGA
jgi:hypothetical protein